MEPNSNIHTCWACLSDLKSGQKFCTNCGNWQNIQKYVIFSNSTLALIVALISVISVTIPIVSAIFANNIFEARFVVNGLADYKIVDNKKIISMSTIFENVGYGSGRAPMQINCTGEAGEQFVMSPISNETIIKPNQKKGIQYESNSSFDSEFSEARCLFISSSEIVGGLLFRLYIGSVIAQEPEAFDKE